MNPALSAVEQRFYFKHFRAVVIQIMLYALKEKCPSDAYASATKYYESYLKIHGLDELGSQGAIGKVYVQASALSAEVAESCRIEKGQSVPAPDFFATLGLALELKKQLTGSRERSKASDRFFHEFLAVLDSCVNDFKCLELTTKR